jgi:hypothetical protein
MNHTAEEEPDPPFRARVDRLIVGHHDDAEPPAVTEAITDDGWVLMAEWQLRGGRLEPVSVRIASDPDGDVRPVTATAIREMPLGEMLAASRQRIDWAARSTSDQHQSPGYSFTLDPATDELVAQQLKTMTIDGPHRGQALSPDDLAAVAAVYRRAWANGETVTRAVQDAFHLSRGGAAKRIMRAREAGLLVDVGPKR